MDEKFSNQGLILYDVDDVLVDWSGGALDLIGRGRHESDVKDVLQSGKGSDFEALFGGRERLVQLVSQAGKEFWMALQPFWWADQLISDALTSNHKVAFLTSPGCWRESASYKIEYLNDRWPGIPVFIGQDKGILGGTNTLLVDDWEKNIVAHRKHGGDTFLFPSAEELMDDAHRLENVREEIRNKFLLLTMRMNGTLHH